MSPILAVDLFPRTRQKSDINLGLSNHVETILGEKIQTILVRERANTRMRDFYDICMLVEVYAGEIKEEDFKAAYEATCRKRESLHIMGNEGIIIDIIKADSKLNNQWVNYQKKFSYASGISFEKTIECAKRLISLLQSNE